MEVLYGTLGFGTGMATSIMNLVAFTIIPHYFEKKRGMAVGLTQAGVGIGLLTFSALNTYLVSTYGVQGALLILSAISLHAIPLGILLRNPSSSQPQHEEPNADTGEFESLVGNKTSIYTEEMGVPINAHGVGSSSAQLPKTKDDEFQNSKLASWSYVLGLDLLNDKHFVLLILAVALINLPHNVVPTVIPDHITWTNGSQTQATATLVTIGNANTCSRLCVWNLSKENVLLWMEILALSSLISGASLASTVLFNQYWHYVILCIVFGVARGIFSIYASLLTMHIVGTKRSHHGFGVEYTTSGIVLLIGMPAFGALAEYTNQHWGYTLVFIGLGVCEISAGLICILLRLLYNKVATVQY